MMSDMAKPLNRRKERKLLEGSFTAELERATSERRQLESSLQASISAVPMMFMQFGADRKHTHTHTHTMTNAVNWH